MVAQFADVSQFQPQNIDFVAYANWARQWDGKARMAMRSSYGNGYKDVHFAQYRQGALAAGIDVILFYHYAYPSLNSAIDEANSQFNIVGAIRPQDILILDFEENVNQATSDWAYTWLAQQESNYGGKLPGLYASTAYIRERLSDARLSKYPLWLADWQFTPDERPPVPTPWTSYQFLQYTDNATNVPGIPGVVDCNVYLGGSTPPQEETVSIDLSNPTVASHFTGDANQWTCKDTKFTLHGEILAFYQQFGGNALCGLSHLGLPLSGETPIPNHPGTVYQRFERGVLAFDPSHLTDNPPGSSRVYMMHIEQGLGQDPRISPLQTEVTDLQAEVASLKALLASSNLGQVASLGQQIADDVALIMKLVEPQ